MGCADHPTRTETLWHCAIIVAVAFAAWSGAAGHDIMEFSYPSNPTIIDQAQKSIWGLW